MSTDDRDPFEVIEDALTSIQIKHFEMSNMVDDYRAMVADLRHGGDPEQIKLARVLPGARYHVATTYVSETWHTVEGQLKRAFPEPPAQ
ncbi:MAG: hypothetical protein RIB67_07280 [Miltoncostaeaceae bacterium]